MTTERCANCIHYGHTRLSAEHASTFCMHDPWNLGVDEGFDMENFPHGAVTFNRTTPEAKCPDFSIKKNRYCVPIKGRS